MPNRWTFCIPPVGALVRRRTVYGSWIDPFAGMQSPAGVRNDLDPEANADSHEDALTWLRAQPGSAFDGAIYDPPYSPRQAAECYKRIGRGNYVNEQYWAQVKDELARVLRESATVICCGWNSNGLGQSRGFTLREVLLVAHGANHHDTIVTVESRAASAPTGPT